MLIKTISKILITLALFLSFPANQVKAESYTLEPSEASIKIPVHLPNEAYGVNVILKKDGNIVLDQSNIDYSWETSNANNIYVYQRGFDSGCPYGINAPCPALHASIIGRNPGNTIVTVRAVKNNQELIGTTRINVQVTNESYNLKPSEAEINMVHNSGSNTQYGVNVLLEKNGQLIKDQHGVYYRWRSNFENSVLVNDYGFQSGCPYNLISPCPNMHADITAVGVGRAIVTVDAFIGNAVVASTSFAVNVRNATITPSPTPNNNLQVTPSVTARPSTTPVYTSPSPVTETPRPNHEGEQIQRLQQQVDDLEEKVEEHESILQRILNFFLNLF